jgi:hypothetical protein
VTRRLRDGSVVIDHRLDRLPSATTEHLEKFPLTAATLPSTPVPVVLGINWYANFDDPIEIVAAGRRRWAIGAGDLGRVRGGHAVCLRPAGSVDLLGWWGYYDQGVEGRCVEFAWHRALSLLNRRRYDITSRRSYWQMQMDDEWEGGSYPGARPVYEGTSVRAGGEVMRLYGPVRARLRGAAIPYADALPVRGDGIAVYRWAQSWDDVRTATGTPGNLPGVPMLNSWGSGGYPHETLLLDEAGERLLAEDGEMAVPTDL